MYNAKYTCKYTTSLNENVDIMNQNTLYRQDILNIFMIDSFTESIINNSLREIFEKIKIHPEFNECMLKMAGQMISDDLELGLLLLYSFDYLYLTHPCICDFLETETIPNEKIKLLLQHIC